MNLDNPRARQPPRAPWTFSRLQMERAVAIGASIDISSAATYNSALQSYITFCRAHTFALDPSPDTLSFYVVYMSHFIKPSSVNSYLSGICSQLEPFFPDVRHARSSALVRRTLTGCLKLYSSPTTRKRPLRRSELIQLAPTFAHSPTFDNALWWSMLLTGFYGLLRLGEMVMPDRLEIRDYRKLVRRLSILFTPTAFSFHLPAHKADRATHLAELGVDPSIIQSIGRWSSDAFRIYIRTHPVILAAILHGHRTNEV
ncbi:hypothetical protein FISHEDRAFT_32525 [Fistulina hepatica ATCC 64428]|uniref:Core-binding (CB) domain-containing protein n=1 Tax=Fistulina hepatica ATCC 64428 TaxID=1128425 RepID=A0A0D7AQ18_9AGAR|nr:hypothetical protein FISHEDRAFT_32525 [Fistulina hepatica ATCC 64428]